MCTPDLEVDGLLVDAADVDCSSAGSGDEADYSELNTSFIEGTTLNAGSLPIDMTFNDGHVLSIATYSILLAISVCGNITVLVNLVRRRHISNPRVNIMLIHLAIADLLVSELLGRRSDS